MKVWSSASASPVTGWVPAACAGCACGDGERRQQHAQRGGETRVRESGAHDPLLRTWLSPVSAGVYAPAAPRGRRAGKASMWRAERRSCARSPVVPVGRSGSRPSECDTVGRTGPAPPPARRLVRRPAPAPTPARQDAQAGQRGTRPPPPRHLAPRRRGGGTRNGRFRLPPSRGACPSRAACVPARGGRAARSAGSRRSRGGW